MAGGEGFEPSLSGSEPLVLPLDDPPVAFRGEKKKGVEAIIFKGSLKIRCCFHNPFIPLFLKEIKKESFFLRL